MQLLTRHMCAVHFTVHDCCFYLTINCQLFNNCLVAVSLVTSTLGLLVARAHIYSSTNHSPEFFQPLPVLSVPIQNPREPLMCVWTVCRNLRLWWGGGNPCLCTLPGINSLDSADVTAAHMTIPFVPHCCSHPVKTESSACS
jgi:hypothetical protein